MTRSYDLDIRPTADAVLAHQGSETHVALSASIHVDLESPISIFRKLAGDEPGAFLLESVEGGELMGRYTFMGFGVRDMLEWEDGVAYSNRGGVYREIPVADPLALLEEMLVEYDMLPAPDLPRFQGGAVGWIGFDAIQCFEDVPVPGGGLGLRPFRMLLPDEVLIYDHLAHRLVLVVHARLDGDRAAAWQGAAERLYAIVDRLSAASLPAEPPWPVGRGDAAALEQVVRSNHTRAGFEKAVAQAKEAIEAGEIFQVVLSQRFTVDAEVEPFTLYRALRALNPSPYMFFLNFDDCTIVGSSPEVLVRLEGDDVLVRPIAGTRKRGVDTEEDAALAADLLADEKELAEHRMLLDLGRNDVGRIAEIGSVRVEDPLHIEKYSHVMHIVSDVRGSLADDKNAFDVFRACFPAGTVSGAPKIRACEILASLEEDSRGIYAGAVGYFDFAGNMDTCIAIRTMVVTDDGVHIQAGAGIVFDSVPANEYEECRNKARASLAAISIALDHQAAASSD